MDAPRTTQIVAKVRRRMLAGAVVSRGAWGALIGSVAGFALVIVSRLGVLHTPDGAERVAWWILLSGCVGGGLVMGMAAGLLKQPTLLAAAQRADAASGLRDRLSNALTFASKSATGSSEQLAIADSERAAARVDVRRVAPLQFGTVWMVWPVLAIGAVACGLWVPVRQAEVREVAARDATPEERDAAAEVIAESAAEAREAIESLAGDRATPEELSRMEDIERELLEGNREPSEALTESAQQLQSMAERIERDAESESLLDQATREELAGAVEGADEDSALARALADGDLAAAREAAEELFDRMDQLSPAERERLAEELERLAEQTSRDTEQPLAAQSQAEEAPEPGTSPRAEQGGMSEAESALREQGIEDAGEIAESTDPEPIRERLEREGVEPEAAERMAEDLAERNRSREAEQRAREEMQELSESAREAAEELRKPRADDPAAEADEPEPEQGGENTGQDPDQSGTDERREQQGHDEQGRDEPGREGQDQSTQREERGESQDRAGRDDTQGQDTQAGEQGEQQGKEQGQERGEGTERQATEEQQDQGQKAQERSDSGAEEQGQETERQQQGEGQPQDNNATEQQGREQGQTEDAAQTGREDQRGTENGQQQGGDANEPQGDGQPKPGDEQGQDEQAAPGEQTVPGEQGDERLTDGRGEAPNPRGVERFRKQLERMAERGESAQEQQEAAERLRERAERMLENASPEQRKQLEDMAREMAEQMKDMPGDDPPGGDTGGTGTGTKSTEGARAAPSEGWDIDDVDARGEPDGKTDDTGRVIAEWFGEDSKRPPGGAQSGNAAAGSTLDQAARGAERAVERRAVPRDKRDLVRRVFERYRQRAAEEAARDDGKQSESGSGG